MNISVAGIVVSDKLVFIGRRNPVGQMGGRWEFPGGKVEEGESPEQALFREFMEEFCVSIQVGEKIAEEKFYHNGQERILYAYSVSFINSSEKWILSEHTEVKWVTFSDILKLDFVDSDMRIYPKVRKYYEKN